MSNRFYVLYSLKEFMIPRTLKVKATLYKYLDQNKNLQYKQFSNQADASDFAKQIEKQIEAKFNIKVQTYLQMSLKDYKIPIKIQNKTQSKSKASNTPTSIKVQTQKIKDPISQKPQMTQQLAGEKQDITKLIKQISEIETEVKKTSKQKKKSAKDAKEEKDKKKQLKKQKSIDKIVQSQGAKQQASQILIPQVKQQQKPTIDKQKVNFNKIQTIIEGHQKNQHKEKKVQSVVKQFQNNFVKQIQKIQNQQNFFKPSKKKAKKTIQSQNIIEENKKQQKTNQKILQTKTQPHILQVTIIESNDTKEKQKTIVLTQTNTNHKQKQIQQTIIAKSNVQSYVIQQKPNLNIPQEVVEQFQKKVFYQNKRIQIQQDSSKPSKKEAEKNLQSTTIIHDKDKQQNIKEKLFQENLPHQQVRVLQAATIKSNDNKQKQKQKASIQSQTHKNHYQTHFQQRIIAKQNLQSSVMLQRQNLIEKKLQEKESIIMKQTSQPQSLQVVSINIKINPQQRQQNFKQCSKDNYQPSIQLQQKILAANNTSNNQIKNDKQQLLNQILNQMTIANLIIQNQSTPLSKNKQLSEADLSLKIKEQPAVQKYQKDHKINIDVVQITKDSIKQFDIIEIDGKQLTRKYRNSWSNSNIFNLPSLFLYSKLLDHQADTPNKQSAAGSLKVHLSQNQNPGLSIARYDLNISGVVIQKLQILGVKNKTQAEALSISKGLQFGSSYNLSNIRIKTSFPFQGVDRYKKSIDKRVNKTMQDYSKNQIGFKRIDFL